MTNRLTEIMESAGNQQNQVCKLRLGVAKAFDPYTLHSRQNMVHSHTNLTNHAMIRSFLLPPLLPRLLLDGLEDDHSSRCKRLKTRILMQLAVRGKTEGCLFHQGFIVNRTGCRLAQEADFLLAKVANNHIFMRVRFFPPL
jgi:hypothetical protein